MVRRSYWLKRIEDAWQRRSIVWLSGVRRAGKTYLCQSLPDIEYFDCELPRVRAVLEDPQSFLSEMRGRRVVLDEIHRLRDPSELLKIAADHYPDVRIIATGSSTLGASAKFRDTLTGRKAEVWLTPMNVRDSSDFGQSSVNQRLLHGGLPPFFMADVIPEAEFQEWMDAYWAKDIQELFRLERRHSFTRFAELLMTRSGGIFEATSYSAPCEVSRGTITNYLSVMEATFLAHVIRPFATYRPTEIVSAPKLYAFDTGFVCYYRGITTLRTDDLGLLWEHLVLNELHSSLQSRDVRYWRDKRGHEIDFVLLKRGGVPTAIECKWRGADFNPINLLAFRRRYPGGENFVAASDIDVPFNRDYGEVAVRFVGADSIAEAVS